MPPEVLVFQLDDKVKVQGSVTTSMPGCDLRNKVLTIIADMGSYLQTDDGSWWHKRSGGGYNCQIGFGTREHGPDRGVWCQSGLYLVAAEGDIG